MRFTRDFVLKILENIPVGIITVDSEGNVTSANRAALKILGSPGEERTKELNIFTLQNIKDAGAEGYFRDAVLKRIPQSFESEYTSYWGKRTHLRVFCVPVERSGKKMSAIIMIEDITDIKKWQNNIYQLQKMESLGILAGSLAHQLNNYLGIIFLNLDLLSERPVTNDPSLRNILESMKIATDEVSELVKKLLAFARPRRSSVEKVDIESLVEGAEKICKASMIKKDIRLVRDFEPDTPPLYGDPLLLKQCLINLTLNSIDAMEMGGDITIQVRVKELDGEYPIRKAGITTGRYARISVIDQGAGMDEETRARMFEPFFTTRGRGEGLGTGLGLTVVFSIVKEHGGFIEVETDKGEGTSLHLYLPIAGAGARNSNP